MTRADCAYFSTLNPRFKRIAGLEELSGCDKIINFLKEKKYDYISLYNSSAKIKNYCPLVSDNYLSSKSIYTNTNFIIPPNEQEDAYEYAYSNRISQNLYLDQNLLVAIAWVIQSERRLFNLFPEVIFVDTFKDTNDEGRPLLTISGCSSDGKMFTFLRSFFPNERTWCFRWIFSHVLPTLFSSEILERVNLIITDGDYCEITQIDNCLSKVMPNAQRGRCAWHAVNRGWGKNGPKVLSKDKQKYQQIVYNCHCWIYSWMNSTIESEEEYIISKQLFEKYVFSDPVINITGSVFGSSVLNFIRGHIEPILTHLLFFKRMNIRHFDQIFNTKLEGVFKGIKYCASPVNPSLTLDKSLTILSNNAERKCDNIQKIKTNDVLKTKTWINLSCGDKLNKRGEQLLSNQWNIRNKYSNVMEKNFSG